MYNLAHRGDISALKSRLSAGTHVDEVDSGGYTALHGACQTGKDEVLDLLMSHSPDLDRPRQVCGNTALHLACVNKHISCVKKLIQAGATVGVGNNWGGTPLHYAGSGEVVQVLMDHGGDLSVRGVWV